MLLKKYMELKISPFKIYLYQTMFRYPIRGNLFGILHILKKKPMLETLTNPCTLKFGVANYGFL
jgi:hypothetical protein